MATHVRRVGLAPPVFEDMRDDDPARSKRVTDAMTKRVELDIATLENVYRG